jgi:uncharacterized protein
VRCALVLLCLSPAARVGAQQPSPTIPALPEIHTTGAAAESLAPDLGTVIIGTATKAQTPGRAGRANARLATAIRKAVVALGVPRDSIVTRDYTSRMNVDSYGRDTTFLATNTVVVRVHNLALIGPIIDTALAEGASEIRGVEYSAAKPEEAGRRALEAATREARANADAMARSAGGRVGRLIELTTVRRGWDESPLQMRGEAANATPITPTPISVQVTVEGRWEFVQAAQ